MVGKRSTGALTTASSWNSTWSRHPAGRARTGPRRQCRPTCQRPTSGRWHRVVSVGAGRVRPDRSMGPSRSRPKWLAAARRDARRSGRRRPARRDRTGRAWSRLPSDCMGSLLDPADLTTGISELLSLTGAFLPQGDSHLRLAVGLSPLLMVCEGPISRLRGRTSATMASASRDRLAVPPDETGSREALGRGARDAGEALARALLTDYRCSGPARH